MRIVRADAAFRLSAEGRPGFPLLVSERGGLFAPGHLYLCELATFGALATSSLQDVAYVLCAWLNHLEGEDLVWDQPSTTFIRWAKMSDEAGRLTVERRRRRARVVFDFYDYAFRNGYQASTIATFLEEFSEPISAEALLSPRVRRTLRLRFGRSPARVGGMRPTPSDEAVDRIGAALLGSGDGYSEVRNWLLVRTTYETNLRTQGLAQLSLPLIDDMLFKQGVIRKSESVGDLRAADRARVRSRIASLADDGLGAFVSAPVFEKGKKRRVVFPLGLVVQLLDFVWAERAEFLRQRRAGTSRARAGHALWLSSKTGLALTRGAIADILKEGFRRADVAGSGHRIRAASAVRQLREMVRSARANGAGRFDAELLLIRLAERMGHEDPETLRPYLNSVLLEDLIDDPVECTK